MIRSLSGRCSGDIRWSGHARNQTGDRESCRIQTDQQFSGLSQAELAGNVFGDVNRTPDRYGSQIRQTTQTSTHICCLTAGTGRRVANTVSCSVSFCRCALRYCGDAGCTTRGARSSVLIALLRASSNSFAVPPKKSLISTTAGPSRNINTDGIRHRTVGNSSLNEAAFDLASALSRIVLRMLSL